MFLNSEDKFADEQELARFLLGESYFLDDPDIITSEFYSTFSSSSACEGLCFCECCDLIVLADLANLGDSTSFSS